MAGVCRAQGDLHGALDLLNQAERLYIRGFSPEVRPIPAFKARVWVALGRLDEALGGRVRVIYLSRTTSATYASLSTSPSPKCSWHVRTHTNRIYAKLGVNDRRAAVRQAQQLDLMPRTRDR